MEVNKNLDRLNTRQSSIALSRDSTSAGLRMKIMAAIAEERTRQDKKWGEQNHLDPVWLTIMAEEFGETAKAMLDKDDSEVAKELVQTIAVGVAWLEAMARRTA